MFDIKLVFALSLLSFAFSQQCIQGTNCPLNQGICNGNTCECLEGFQTFYNKIRNFQSFIKVIRR